MWTYAPWQGRYLPHPLSPRERLSAYATWCNAVEGNTTFYATPTLDTVKSWADQTDPDFRFILKLPRPITHERRLADVDEPLRAFLSAIEPLGPRAHAIWIQLPPSFGPADLGALAGFLRRLPREHRYCVEVRDREFFEDPRAEQQLERALGYADAEWATFDTTVLFGNPPTSAAEREAWTKKPRLPAGRGPSRPSPSSATSAGTTTRGRSRDGSPGSTTYPAGCARGAPRPSSSTRPTTSTRSSWRAGSTTTSGPWSPRSSRFPSRSRPGRRRSSEHGRRRGAAAVG